jgi:hypothetical protein
MRAERAANGALAPNGGTDVERTHFRALVRGHALAWPMSPWMPDRDGACARAFGGNRAPRGG